MKNSVSGFLRTLRRWNKRGRNFRWYTYRSSLIYTLGALHPRDNARRRRLLFILSLSGRFQSKALVACSMQTIIVKKNCFL